MRYIVENVEGGVCDVTNMFNSLGLEVTKPDAAESIVVRVADDCWVSASAEDYAIHTVH